MDDNIDFIERIEQEALQEGKTQGFREGQIRAVSDGYNFALSEGKGRGDELAYYTALCNIALAWTSKDEDPHASSSTVRSMQRIRRSALQMQKMIANFPIFRDTREEDDVGELLKKIRAKSKMLSASLHLGHINLEMGLVEDSPPADNVEEALTDPSSEEIFLTDV